MFSDSAWFSHSRILLRAPFQNCWLWNGFPATRFIFKFRSVLLYIEVSLHKIVTRVIIGFLIFRLREREVSVDSAIAIDDSISSQKSSVIIKFKGLELAF